MLLLNIPCLRIPPTSEHHMSLIKQRLQPGHPQNLEVIGMPLCSHGVLVDQKSKLILGCSYNLRSNTLPCQSN